MKSPILGLNSNCNYAHLAEVNMLLSISSADESYLFIQFRLYAYWFVVRNVITSSFRQKVVKHYLSLCQIQMYTLWPSITMSIIPTTTNYWRLDAIIRQSPVPWAQFLDLHYDRIRPSQYVSILCLSGTTDQNIAIYIKSRKEITTT